MHVIKVLEDILAREGLRPPVLSAEMGKGRTYINSLLNRRDSVPNLDTVIAILDACGYDLIARNRADDSEHVIEP